MTWSYRVMRRMIATDDYDYGIYEVYPSPLGWTETPMSPSGTTLQELINDLEYMRRALKRPALDHETGKPIKDKT